MSKRILVATAILLLTAATGAAAEPHAFTAKDLHDLDRISDPQVSPDGKTVAFTVRTTDWEANRGRTDLWLVGIDGAGQRRLTTDPASDSSPRWAPDGESLFFLSSRSGSSQVWRIAPDGGEARQVTDLPLDVSGFLLSPDGENLAVALEIFPDCHTLECTAKRLGEREASPVTGHLYEKVFIRHWDTWKDGRRSHVFIVPVAGGEAVDVMKGMDADGPSKPFGGMEEVAFHPTKATLTFTARDGRSGEPWSTDFDLYKTTLGGKEPVVITGANEAWDTGPAYSPDGRYIAYLAMNVPGYEADRFRVVLHDLPAAKSMVLTEDWDYSARSVTWAPDGKEIYVTAADVGQVSLFRLDLDGGKVAKITKVHGDGHVRSPSVTPDGERIVFGRDTLASPVELFSIKTDGTDLRQITDINGERLATMKMSGYEQFSFEGWNGETVHAYMVEPVDFDASKKYPVAFLIHGGPQGSFGNDFHYRWNPQAYTGAGYAAVMVDFHGSTGYGQAFTDSIRGDWGGKPLEDLQKGLAAALERYPWMDGDRVCALGASYGGYMINWIAGNWPDRFRCLVNHDGTFDTRSMYYETEELWFPEWDTEGTPWDNPEGYAKDNPVLHVDKWRTPMLVIHGALDYRVPETQGIGAFNALQRRGVPSRFLYFPDENHWVLKPHNGVYWHRVVLDWLAEWTAAD